MAKKWPRQRLFQFFFKTKLKKSKFKMHLFKFLVIFLLFLVFIHTIFEPTSSLYRGMVVLIFAQKNRLWPILLHCFSFINFVKGIFTRLSLCLNPEVYCIPFDKNCKMWAECTNILILIIGNLVSLGTLTIKIALDGYFQVMLNADLNPIFIELWSVTLTYCYYLIKYYLSNVFSTYFCS